MRVRVLHRRGGGEELLLGTATVPLRHLARGGAEERWHPLLRPDGAPLAGADAVDGPGWAASAAHAQLPASAAAFEPHPDSTAFYLGAAAVQARAVARRAVRVVDSRRRGLVPCAGPVICVPRPAVNPSRLICGPGRPASESRRNDASPPAIEGKSESLRVIPSHSGTIRVAPSCCGTILGPFGV